ncbi:MAG: hypothetical protein SPJ74_06015 [Bacilli bacterium]|nr:hypothetical protein [Bacilli bacterium]
MNNYCRNCGEKLTNFSVCEKCGTKILTNRVGELDRLLAKKYIRIFFTMLILYFISYVIMFMLPDAYILYALVSPIINFLPLALIIFVIFAKKKLKYSKFFNIVFWIMLLLITLFILFILFMLISCEYKF